MFGLASGQHFGPWARHTLFPGAAAHLPQPLGTPSQAPQVLSVPFRPGCGKSTLMKAITGQEGVRLSTGKLAIHPTWRVGMLEQKGVSGSTLSVREEVMSRMSRLIRATEALNAAEEAMEGCDASGDLCILEKCAEDYSYAQAEFEAAGGYTVDEKVAKVLKGLGFEEAEFEQPCSSFSGGWQMRIGLARLLLSEPELLILDEREYRE